MVLAHGYHPVLSKRLIVAGEIGKVKGDISNFRFANACEIELRAFREAGTFIRLDGEMLRLLAYFDNPDYHEPGSRTTFFWFH